jgi:hypothetical protein
MLVAIDISGGCQPYYRSGQLGSDLLNWISKYAEGIAIYFDQDVKPQKPNFGATGANISTEIPRIMGGGGTDLACLEPYLTVGDQIKVVLTDGHHPPITYSPRNTIFINPCGGIQNPKGLALQLSLLDDTLREIEKSQILV